MKFIIGLLVSLASTAVFAQQAPNLIGIWNGETNDATIGEGRIYPGGSPGQIRFLKEKISYKVDKQEGRAFSGVISIKGSNIPMVGSLSGDFTSGAIATKQGTTSFKILDPNRIALCFSTTTIDPVNKNAGPVADCHEISRK
ncbi:hypothetical protein G6733_05005 [Polynucleobacter paneuropaeus]|nr:hypothetical protein G6733_05005 [Polynucleobacter paneuropaeus]